MEGETGGIRFSADEWMAALDLDLYDEGHRARIEALQWQLGEQLLSRGQTVIIEWGTWGRSERDALRIRARQLGAAVELHYLSAPVDVLFNRIQRRGVEDPPIGREDLLKWANRFEVPADEEMLLYDRAHTIAG